MARHPSLGLTIEELPTPSLLLDLDVFEANCAKLASALKASNVAWRPHTKGHKSPRLARKMMEAGAVGVTCAKVGEAEVMVGGGIDSVLIANQPSTREAWARLARLNRAAWVAAAVDCVEHVEMAAEAGRAAGVEIPLLIEVDIGMDRAGVRSSDEAVALAQAMVDADVIMAGVMGYEGHILDIWPFEEKKAVISTAIGIVIDAKDAIEAAGIPVEVVSCGGSGSYEITSEVPGVTEIQAGGGCLMDIFYRETCHVDLDHALFLVGSVASRPTPDRAIVDTGWKALPARVGHPVCADLPDVKVAQLYAEHLRLEKEGGLDLEIGERVVFIPGYSDETTVLHNEFLGIRKGTVVEVIPLEARGVLQ